MKRGFSLIELLIVISIMALLACISIVGLRAGSQAHVRLELDTLHTACLYCQRCAQSTGQQHILTIDLADNSYTYNGFAHKLAQSVVFGCIPAVAGPPANPTHAIENAITFANHQIIFYPDGIVQSGSVYLTDTHKKVMYALTSGVGEVSFLRKYSYNGAWKML